MRFSPEGLQFNAGHAPTLTLDYSSCPAGRLNILKHIAYTTERLRVLTRLLSLDNLLQDADFRADRALLPVRRRVVA